MTDSSCPDSARPPQRAVVGRYAPSPTGALHLGNLRTALAAWAHARHHGGRFLLRVEDIDTPRVKPGCEQRQLADLEKLGLDWDGKPLRQSECQEEYTRAFEMLRERGVLYPCFCSRREIQLALSAPHRGDQTSGYPGTCRVIPEAEVGHRMNRGDQHCWRMRVPSEAVVVEEKFLGVLQFDLGREGGDFVVRRADNLFAYQLVCAWDDAVGGMTHVVRGEDLVDSAARQQLIQQALGFIPPAWLHLPLLLAEDGRRLSKRDGDDDLEALLAAGFDAGAVRGYLAWTLGQCEAGERLSASELAQRFDIRKIPRTAFRFRPRDLDPFRD